MVSKIHETVTSKIIVSISATKEQWTWEVEAMDMGGRVF